MLTENSDIQHAELIAHAVTGHLTRLRHTLECWQLRCRFSSSFKVDLEESGFPLFRHVLDIATDKDRREELVADLPDPQQLRAEMVDWMLKYKKHPRDLQTTMAKRLYYDALLNLDPFDAFTQPEMLRHSYNSRAARPYYIMQWSCYDGAANLPMVYVAVIEDSSDDAPQPPRRRDGPWGYREPDDANLLNGLPNLKLTRQFRDFCRNHSSYSLNLTSIATAMDKDFPELHPKQLHRFVLGPFYAGGLTKHNEKVQSVLDSVASKSENWLLTWAAQELLSKEEVPAKKSIWGGTPANEIFYINTDDIDCVTQGVSSLEKYALIPHTAYQATFAQGKADEIFDDYKCHIVSGNDIIPHV